MALYHSLHRLRVRAKGREAEGYENHENRSRMIVAPKREDDLIYVRVYDLKALLDDYDRIDQAARERHADQR